MDAPPTAQRKAKTKGKASPFPVPRPGTLPVVSQWFLNEFVPRSLPRECLQPCLHFVVGQNRSLGSPLVLGQVGQATGLPLGG